jgi:hypothetical protein
MRRILVFITTLCLAGAAYAQNDAARVFHGTVYVESYNRTMVVAIDTNADGRMDDAFAAATEEPYATHISYRWRNADVLFKAGGVMITAPDEREALIATFRRDVPRAGFSAPEAFHVTRVANLIGLAYHYNLAYEYRMDRMPSGNGSSSAGRTASEYTFEDGWTREPFQNDWGWSGSGGGSCTSGGSGATQCSISGCTNTSGRNDCSVSCIQGYYACCNCGSCGCYRYDGRN